MKYFEEVEVDNHDKIMEVLKSRGYTPPESEQPFVSESIWTKNGEPRPLIKIKTFPKRPGIFFVQFSDKAYTPRYRVYRSSRLNKIK